LFLVVKTAKCKRGIRYKIKNFALRNNSPVEHNYTTIVLEIFFNDFKLKQKGE